MILFETPHGSHLYGTAHANSDRDTYRVVTRDSSVLGHNRRGKDISQVIRGEDDILTIDFSTWVRQLQFGVPQAWEAAFSGIATVDRIPDFRYALRAGTTILTTYQRTMKAFSFDERDGGVKKRRHALRLGLNARQILETGRFEPSLTPEQASATLEAAQGTAEEVYELAQNLMWGSKTL